MTPQTKTATRQKATRPRIRMVALCDIDPAKFAMLPQGMPASRSDNVLLVLDCAEAIHAAMNGEVDVLVLDGRQVTIEGLTALSFLRQECPGLPVYFYLEEKNAAPRLQPWDLAA